MAVIGIDLGTTNSLAGVWQDGKVVLIPNAFGEYLTPSVVSIGKIKRYLWAVWQKKCLQHSRMIRSVNLKEIWAQIFCTETAEKIPCRRTFGICIKKIKRRCGKVSGRRSGGSGYQCAGVF